MGKRAFVLSFSLCFSMPHFDLALKYGSERIQENWRTCHAGGSLF